MPTPIIPNAIPSIVTTLPAPNDGEIANSASLTQFVTPLVDDVEAFRLLTYGGGMRRKVICTSDTVLTVYPLGAVVVNSGGTWKVFTHTVSTVLDPTALAGGALVANTRYWLYAYDNAGALGFTVSATGPDANLHYMTGNASYFYVSVFHTLPAAANIATYSQTDNDFQYTSTAAYLLIAGSALVVTPLTMWCVPPQATHFRYWAEINATLAGRNALIGEATSWHILLDPTGMGYAGVRGEFGEFSLVAAGASTGVFKYSVSDAATVVTIQCTGFRM